ncbi:MAG: hypothetical protein AB7S41_17170 [Parvibaculaceae bacterium]
MDSDVEAESFLADCALLTGYNQSWCKAEQARFIQLFQRALGRDYHSQRSVASCFAGGCDGAVKVNYVAACAWRVLILESGYTFVNSIDSDNYKIDCASLEADQAQKVIRTQAGSLMLRIYGKPLPATH